MLKRPPIKLSPLQVLNVRTAKELHHWKKINRIFSMSSKHEGRFYHWTIQQLAQTYSKPLPRQPYSWCRINYLQYDIVDEQCILVLQSRTSDYSHYGVSLFNDVRSGITSPFKGEIDKHSQLWILDTVVYKAVHLISICSENVGLNISKSDRP